MIPSRMIAESIDRLARSGLIDRDEIAKQLEQQLEKIKHSYHVLDVPKITDGDTYWMDVDLGFRGRAVHPIRLMGYDCPESRGPSNLEKEMAYQATSVATLFIQTALHRDALCVRTKKNPDSFGRWIGEVWNESTGEILGVVLEYRGLATKWPTRWRDVHVKEGE